MKTKTLFTRIFLALAAVLLFLPLIGQDTIPNVNPVDPEGFDLSQFIDLYNLLYVAAVNILGYVHNWIPGLNKISSKWVRIILIGAVVAVIFNLAGLSNGLGTVLLFLQAVGFYEIILKRVQPSPTAATSKTDA